jgi:arsenate reductase
MTEPVRILILCTGNSARSILGEVLLRDLGAGRFEAFSAGSQPKGAPHPAALALLAARGHAIDGLASKSWDVFAAPGAPKLDAAITVCASAAGETCPVFFGAPARAHWGLEDPAAVTDPPEAVEAAFAATYAALEARVRALVARPDADLAPDRIAATLAAIHAAA